jgi:L-alanine-DL-glutamate epimerase-like enolase superfamily enzyme
VPHQTQPTIGTICNIHFAARFDNSSRAQEYNHDPEKSKQLWAIFKKSYEPQSGYMQVPDGSGLGLELDEAAMKRLIAE